LAVIFAIPQYNPGTLAEAGFRSLKRFSEKPREISIHFADPGKQMVYRRQILLNISAA
jgi:hypothetical protein